jgi:YlmC/YmxH family sporulation protein
MRLSDLQTKEIINMSTGKRLGLIIDVIVDNSGFIKSLILEEKKGRRIAGREEYELDWKQIAKIGDDIILVKDKYDIK